MRWNPGVGQVATVMALCAAPACAQDQVPGWTRCSEEHGAVGSILGVVRPPSDTTRLRGRVILRQDSTHFWCDVSPDEGGAFEFHGVPVGPYRVTVGSWGLEPIPPLEVDVEADRPVRLVIPARRRDYVADCMRDARCAGVLSRATTAELRLEAPQALRVAAYRLAIALSMRSWPENPETVACVPAELVEPLAEVYAAVSPTSACSWPEPRTSETRLRHSDTGRDAVLVEVTSWTLTSEDTGRLAFGYHAAGLWAAGYECTIERVAGVWTPGECRVTWVA